MGKSKEVIGYEISLSARDDGTVEAAYIRLRRGKSDRTQEIIEDALLADYDEQGTLLGIEVLAPVKLAELVKLVDQPRRTSFRRFIRKAAPSELVQT
jgi:uncharacterized protein YuzE